VETDALLLGVLHFPGAGRHLGPGTTVDNGHRFGTQAQRRAGSVDGHVSSADNRDVVAHGYRLPQIQIPQKDCTRCHAFQILSGDAELAFRMRPHAGEHGVIVAAQVIQRRAVLAADGCIQFDLDAERLDAGDLAVQYVAGQAIIGDAHSEHATGDWQCLENSHAIALECQIVSRRQSCRPGANDRHRLVSVYLNSRQWSRLAFQVGDKALQGADGNGLVVLSPVAGILAGVVTHASNNARERYGPPDEGQGLSELALANESHIALDVDMGRAGIFAGRPATFVNGVFVRYSLGKGDIDGVAIGQVHVELVGDDHWTDLGAVAATGALVQVHVTSFLEHPGLEGSSVPRYAQRFGIG
jgi:hypothetical protein